MAVVLASSRSSEIPYCTLQNNLQLVVGEYTILDQIPPPFSSSLPMSQSLPPLLADFGEATLSSILPHLSIIVHLLTDSLLEVQSTLQLAKRLFGP